MTDHPENVVFLLMFSMASGLLLQLQIFSEVYQIELLELLMDLTEVVVRMCSMK